MVAGTPQEGVAPDGDWQQVSVFLSVVDVHVNRSPYSGEVVESSYRTGSFLAAYRKESAHRNERSELWLRNTDGPATRTVVFRQIVGVLARRIVTRTGPGQRLATGERMGLMKFGSRMDVFLPPEVHPHRAQGPAGARRRDGHRALARGRLRAPCHHATEHRRVRPRLRPRQPPTGAGRTPQPLHAEQHDVRVRGDPGVDPRPLPGRRHPDRDLDRLRHHRRRRRPAGRGGDPLRPPVRLPRRPGVLRSGPGAAGLHAVLAGARPVGSARLDRLLPLGGLRGHPAGAGQHHGDRRPTRGTSPACRAPALPAWSWRRCSPSAT